MKTLKERTDWFLGLAKKATQGKWRLSNTEMPVGHPIHINADGWDCFAQVWTHADSEDESRANAEFISAIRDGEQIIKEQRNLLEDALNFVEKLLDCPRCEINDVISSVLDMHEKLEAAIGESEG